MFCYDQTFINRILKNQCTPVFLFPFNLDYADTLNHQNLNNTARTFCTTALQKLSDINGSSPAQTLKVKNVRKSTYVKKKTGKKKRSHYKHNVKQGIINFLSKRRRRNAQRFKNWYETFKIAQPDKFCLVTINKTKNNTHGIISNLFGSSKTLWSTSGGVYTNKINGRRKTRFVQRAVYTNIIRKLFALGLQFLIIHCKGSFINKRFIFKTFSKNLKVILIKDVTGIPHNGCRPPKVRRV